MKFRLLALATLLFGLSACMKEELPMDLPAKGNSRSETLRLGADYGTQFYYNLKEQKVVYSCPVGGWHLAFENAANAEGVYINGGAGLALVNTHKSDFGSVSSEDCYGNLWLQDNPDGRIENSAFGQWNLNQLTRDNIYIARLDLSGNNFRTIKLRSVTPKGYELEVGDLNTGFIIECFVPKDVAHVYTYFDLKSLMVVPNIEPVKESWDILFTRYGFTFYDQDPPLPYIVTGVLNNPKTEVLKDSTHSFYDIEADILTNCSLSTDRDIIGYDWKYYNFDLGIFHVRQDYNYIIKTQNNDYFKLRFLSFYDDHGVKGTPTFEFRQIQ